MTKLTAQERDNIETILERRKGQLIASFRKTAQESGPTSERLERAVMGILECEQQIAHNRDAKHRPYLTA